MDVAVNFYIRLQLFRDLLRSKCGLGSIMFLGFQETPSSTPPRSFDADVKEPAPAVLVAELAPSSVNFNVFFWTNSRQASVLSVTDRAMTGIKLALDHAGIDIPYPHTVVLTQSGDDGAPAQNG